MSSHPLCVLNLLNAEWGSILSSLSVYLDLPHTVDWFSQGDFVGHSQGTCDMLDGIFFRRIGLRSVLTGANYLC